MGLESGTYIDDLVAANPLGSDNQNTADDHLRLLKSVILATFPNITGAMTASHTELNKLDGVTVTTAEINYLAGVSSAIQTQLDAKLAKLVGEIIMWPTNTVPTGYLECDGSAVSRTTYADLFAVIGTTYGDGDSVTTFNLPDYRGMFLRGYDHGAGVDPDITWNVTGDTTSSSAVITNVSDTTRLKAGQAITNANLPTGTTIVSVDSATQITVSNNATGSSSGTTLVIYARTDRGDNTLGDNVGTRQDDDFEAHTHDMRNDGRTTISGGYPNAIQGTGYPTGSTGGNETRPINVSIMFCIRY